VPTLAPIPEDALALARGARQVAVLSGAGVSAESGVPTFRDAQTGLWARFDPAQLAAPQAWHRDQQQVWAWYMWRHRLVRGVEPNDAHRAIARWERSAELTVITQNVDDLHERAGSTEVHHLHGSLFSFRCDTCGHPYEGEVQDVAEPVARLAPPLCPVCGSSVRPDVVWFGEYLPEGPWQRSMDAVRSCDLLLVVGTSGVVHPAAGLPALAREQGVPVIEVNPERTPLSAEADYSIRSSAAAALPALVPS
jgi:NAD-dependent deacetylase